MPTDPVIADLCTKLGTLTGRIDALIETCERREKSAGDVADRVLSLEESRTRGIGFIAGVSAVVSVLSFLLSNFGAKLFR